MFAKFEAGCVAVHVADILQPLVLLMDINQEMPKMNVAGK